MPDMLYVGLQEDNRIAVFAVDGDSGRLTRRADVAAAGGPSVTAISPDRNTLYVGCREWPSIASYRIDPATGGLSLLGTTAQTDAPTFLAPDRVSSRRKGLYGALAPTLSTRTVLTRRHAPASGAIEKPDLYQVRLDDFFN